MHRDEITQAQARAQIDIILTAISPGKPGLAGCPIK